MVIIVYLVGRWPTFHRRPMLEAMARQTVGQATILCLNRPVSIRKYITSLGKNSEEGLLPFHGPNRLTENLYLGTPVVLLPRVGRWQKDSLERSILKHQIKRALSKVATGHKIVSWVYRPEQLPFLNLVDESYAVYECYDEYSFSHFDGSLIPGVEDKEKDLIKKADLVFTTSYSLFESRRKRHPNVHYAPNGVDFDLFNQAAQNKLLIAEDLKKIPSPRIGFIGNLSGRIDFSLIENIAKHERSWSVVMIGSVQEEVKAELTALKCQENVYYFGYKTREILPQYLKGFDVCILPLKMHAWNKHANPLKLWEYLAAGKPIVSTPTKEMGALKEVIWLAEDHVTFVSAVKKAMYGATESHIASGIEIARQHSWDDLTRKMFKTVQKYFNEHRF